jgi:hypothetical protein
MSGKDILWLGETPLAFNIAVGMGFIVMRDFRRLEESL